MWYNGTMELTKNLTNLVLDIFEVAVKTYSIICKKPYVTVKVQFTPQRDRAGKVTKELIAFTIINESGPEIDVQRIGFLTSFNRLLLPEFLDSKLPIKVLGKDRATYFLPIEELKAALNKSVGETIVEAVVFDKTEHKHVGRVDKVAQEEFAK